MGGLQGFREPLTRDDRCSGHHDLALDIQC